MCTPPTVATGSYRLDWTRLVCARFDMYVLACAAWYGDKLLGYHVAKCTVELFGTSLDRDVASKIAAVALSNRHLYKNVSIILPGYEASWTAPTAGTSVEAAVALVRAEENEDLAQWLVKTAINAKIKGAR